MEYDWDWHGAEADLAHAVALNANSVEALGAFGQFLSAMGRHDEATDALEQARRLDPRSVETLQHLAIARWMAGQGEWALAAVDESLKVLPGSSRAHYGRMMILDQLGRHDEAMALREPLRRRMRVFLPSSLWPTMMAEVPEARASEPRSPILDSMLQMTVPSGMRPTGSTLPIESCAWRPQYTYWPEFMPSTATITTLSCLNLYP